MVKNYKYSNGIKNLVNKLHGEYNGESYALGQGKEGCDIDLSTRLPDDLSCKEEMCHFDYVGTYVEVLPIKTVMKFKDDPRIKAMLDQMNEGMLKDPKDDGFIIVLLFDEKYDNLYLYGYEYNWFNKEENRYCTISKYWEAQEGDI